MARDAAGTRSWDAVRPDGSVPATVAEVLAAAVEALGPRLASVLPHCRVWVDGEPAEPGDAVAPGAEVAVLPPVSGG